MVSRIIILIGMLSVPTAQAMGDGTAPGAHHQEFACIGSQPGFFKSPLDGEVLIRRPAQVLPLQLQLMDASATEVSHQRLASPPVLQVMFMGEVDGDREPNELRNSGRGNEGNSFKYRGGLWQFNLSTSDYIAPGRYSVTVEAGDDSYAIVPACTATFVVQ